jgi:hypothetical protein
MLGSVIENVFAPKPAKEVSTVDCSTSMTVIIPIKAVIPIAIIATVKLDRNRLPCRARCAKLYISANFKSTQMYESQDKLSEDVFTYCK